MVPPWLSLAKERVSRSRIPNFRCVLEKEVVGLCVARQAGEGEMVYKDGGVSDVIFIRRETVRGC